MGRTIAVLEAVVLLSSAVTSYYTEESCFSTTIFFPSDMQPAAIFPCYSCLFLPTSFALNRSALYCLAVGIHLEILFPSF